MNLLIRGINAVVLVLGLVSAAVWLTPRYVQKNAVGELNRDTSPRAGAQVNSENAFFEIVSRCIGTYCFTPPALASVKCDSPTLVAG